MKITYIHNYKQKTIKNKNKKKTNKISQLPKEIKNLFFQINKKKHLKYFFKLYVLLWRLQFYFICCNILKKDGKEMILNSNLNLL